MVGKEDMLTKCDDTWCLLCLSVKVMMVKVKKNKCGGVFVVGVVEAGME